MIMDNIKIFTTREGHHVHVKTSIKFKEKRSIQARMAAGAKVSKGTKSVALTEERLMLGQEILMRVMIDKIVLNEDVPAEKPDANVVTDEKRIIEIMDDLNGSDGEAIFNYIDEVYTDAESGGIDQKKA